MGYFSNRESKNTQNNYFTERAKKNAPKNQGSGLGYTLGKLGTGAFGILEGIWDFSAGGLAKLFGADEWAEEQFANNITQDWNQYLDDWYNPSDAMRTVGDIASGVGNSLVAVGTVAVGSILSGGTITPALASIIAGSTIGIGAAGQSVSFACQGRNFAKICCKRKKNMV